MLQLSGGLKEFSFLMKDISLKALLEAGCHFGHQTVRWNPKMRPYIYASREGIHIFDLAKTKEGLENGAAFAKATASQGGKILFVGTKRQSREMVEKTAREIGMPYVSQRWLGGTLTNFEQIKKSINKLADMKAKRASGEYKVFTKKEQLLLDRQIARFEKFLGGMASVDQLPEAIFIVDVKKEWAAAAEAQRTGVKVIAMVDTNGDPDLVDYVIPTNDDATKAIELVVNTMGEAITEGLKKKAGVKEILEKEETKKEVKKVKKTKKEESAPVLKEEIKEEALAIEEELVNKAQ